MCAWGRTANRTVPITNRQDSPWSESSRSYFALFWSFWLATHSRGSTELPKKMPIGIQLKSTRRSETRNLRHATPRRDENPTRRQGGVHVAVSTCKRGHGDLLRRSPWSQTGICSNSESVVLEHPSRQTQHRRGLPIRVYQPQLSAVTPWCNTLRPAPHCFELLRSATSTTPHYTRKMRPGVRGACGSNTWMHVLARRSPIGLKARARFMSGEQQAMRDLSSTANCN